MQLESDLFLGLGLTFRECHVSWSDPVWQILQAGAIIRRTSVPACKVVPSRLWQDSIVHKRMFRVDTWIITSLEHIFHAHAFVESHTCHSCRLVKSGVRKTGLKFSLYYFNNSRKMYRDNISYQQCHFFMNFNNYKNECDHLFCERNEEHRFVIWNLSGDLGVNLSLKISRCNCLSFFRRTLSSRRQVYISLARLRVDEFVQWKQSRR